MHFKHYYADCFDNDLENNIEENNIEKNVWNLEHNINVGKRQETLNRIM